jgi:Kef-type K+ transport system membrane component KefB
MDHLDVPQFLGLLVVMLGAAKLFGALAQWIGQPAVLGELVAGVVLGMSVMGLVNPKNEVLHLLAELGVVILLFEIGLETDLRKLLQVGGAATAVAIVGVALPFALGYTVCWMLGLGNLVAIVAGATLTATSVGITARVLSDLNRLQEPESQIILGAAVIDDVVGLIILAVVSGLTQGQDVTTLGVLKTTGIAFGFLVGTLLLGRLVVPPLVRLTSRTDLPGTPTMLAVMLAFGLAWLASVAGSAMIIGAFAAGLLLRNTPQAREIERGVAHLGHFFVPIFFVVVGAAVDVSVLNPVDPANRQTLLIGGLLIVAAVIGKFFAGYAPFWFKGNKKAIGVGMIPRGEVGLIFAQMGLAAGVFDPGLFSAVTLMVMVTTFMAPPLLKFLFPPIRPQQDPVEPEGIEDLVTEP